MAIYIFSRSVHSGKTTELYNWCRERKGVAGVLMPDIEGSRKIYNMETGKFFDIECTDPTADETLLTSVGRFHFYTEAFEKANNILLNASAKKPGWLVVDEAGKLELEGKGFYNAIRVIVAQYDDPTNSLNLLITVREGLCDEVIRFFNLRNYRIIRQLSEIDHA